MDKEDFKKLMISELNKLTNEEIKVMTEPIAINNKLFCEISVFHKSFEIVYKGKYRIKYKK